MISDSTFTTECDLTVMVYSFGDTVEVQLTGGAVDTFQEEAPLFEQRLSEILGLDVLVTGFVQLNAT